MDTLLPRLLGAVAGGLVTFLSVWLEKRLNLELGAAEQAAMVGALVTFGLSSYGLIHRWYSAKVNPADVAKAPPATATAKEFLTPGKTPESSPVETAQ